MRVHTGRITNFLFFLAIFLFPLAGHAADFGAEIVDVDGSVYVIQKTTGKKIPAKVGMKMSPGDVIETAAEAEAEILYDDGNVTRLDEDTRLEITKLSVDPDKTRESKLNLAFGRIKNSVSKLTTTKSKFEVNSKTVTAGVTGTPPWVVNVIGGKNPAGPVKTEIDLLKGEKGGVFVRGTDSKATAIILTPGTRTVAQMGLPPMTPFPISAARMNELQAKMPITTPPAVREEKRKQLDTKLVEVSKDKKEETKEEKKEDVKKSDEPAKSDAKGDAAASSENGGGASESAVGGAAAAGEAVAGGAATAADTAVTGTTGTVNTGSGGTGTGPTSEASISGKTGGSGLVMDYMTHVVSVAPVAAPSTASSPGQDATGQSTETQISQGANAIAGATTSAVSATTRVRVQVGVVYK